MNDLPDRDLRERFAALRREDAAGAPSFHAVRAMARPAGGAHRRGSPILAVGVVALLLLAALVVFHPRAPRAPLVSLSTTRWQSPTDFLLRVPGVEYLTTVPRLTYRFAAPEWRNP